VLGEEDLAGQGCCGLLGDLEAEFGELGLCWFEHSLIFKAKARNGEVPGLDDGFVDGGVGACELSGSEPVAAGDVFLHFVVVFDAHVLRVGEAKACVREAVWCNHVALDSAAEAFERPFAEGEGGELGGDGDGGGEGSLKVSGGAN
jgi:hypothetical protein